MQCMSSGGTTPLLSTTPFPPQRPFLEPPPRKRPDPSHQQKQQHHTTWKENCFTSNQIITGNCNSNVLIVCNFQHFLMSNYTQLRNNVDNTFGFAVFVELDLSPNYSLVNLSHCFWGITSCWWGPIWSIHHTLSGERVGCNSSVSTSSNDQIRPNLDSGQAYYSPIIKSKTKGKLKNKLSNITSSESSCCSP